MSMVAPASTSEHRDNKGRAHRRYIADQRGRYSFRLHSGLFSAVSAGGGIL